MTNKKKISIIVPCFNEEEVLPLFHKEFMKVFNNLKSEYELILVNDGSKDKTLEVMKKLSKKDSNITYLSFSRNFGKESAMYAGLCNAKGDYIGFIDADLQHPPALLKEMIKALDTGNYLSSIFLSILNPAFLPALAFIIACLISFATGTSMGTMAIMFVIALPMAINLGVNVPLVAGAIFGGSIFGDHTSPISDTTIMSCSTSGCDIIDHIKTQSPYCIIFAGASIILYTILGFVM